MSPGNVSFGRAMAPFYFGTKVTALSLHTPSAYPQNVKTPLLITVALQVYHNVRYLITRYGTVYYHRVDC